MIFGGLFTSVRLKTPALLFELQEHLFAMQKSKSTEIKCLVQHWNPPLDARRSLTQTRVVTREPVSVTTGAVVTSHGVVTLVLTASVLFAALVYICQSQTDSAPLTNRVELRIQSLRCRRAESCRNTEAQCRAVWQKPATLSFELNVKKKNILSRRWWMRLCARPGRSHRVWWVTALLCWTHRDSNCKNSPPCCCAVCQGDNF